MLALALVARQCDKYQNLFFLVQLCGMIVSVFHFSVATKLHVLAVRNLSFRCNKMKQNMNKFRNTDQYTSVEQPEYQ